MRTLIITMMLCIACTGKSADTSSSEPSTAAPTSEPGTEGPNTLPPTNDCSTMCELAQDCTGLQDQELIFGSDQASCESNCAELDASMSDCALSAADCSALGECTRHSTVADDVICQGVCELASSCGLSTDAGQCSIDCNMVLGGFNGVYYGAGIQCWENAIELGDCEAAQQCPPLFF